MSYFFLEEIFSLFIYLFSFMLYLYFCKRFFFYEQLGKVDESGSWHSNNWSALFDKQLFSTNSFDLDPN